MYELTLLRHAESQGNIEKRHQGQAEYPLTELGRQQAAPLAARWRAEGVAFERIYASPLQRARLTAEAIQQALAAPLVFDELLVERHLGQLTGLTHEVAASRCPAAVPHPIRALRQYRGRAVAALPARRANAAQVAPAAARQISAGLASRLPRHVHVRHSGHQPASQLPGAALPFSEHRLRPYHLRPAHAPMAAVDLQRPKPSGASAGQYAGAGARALAEK